jgi:DNA-binding CsgD family transcriptional regulator
MNVSDDFRAFCSQMDFDLNLKNYKDKLIDWDRLDESLILKNQFFWINDYSAGNNIYIHPNVETVTGYHRENFREFSFAFSITHPDDHDYAYEFSKRTIALTKDYKNELLKDPYFASFSVDFRLKCKDGHYIRVNRHTCCFKTDSEGNMVYALVMFTNISHIKKTDHMSFTWFGNDKFKLYFDDLTRKYNNNLNITSREKDVLSRLADGFSATKIARQLSLSVHTVISHRKNLLKKTGTKNTAQLVRFALEKELI